MHRGFSNTFTWDVYSLVYARQDIDAFKNLIDDCKSLATDKQEAAFAEGLKKLLMDEITSQSHIAPGIYSNLWYGFIYHAFEKVVWEEVAREFIGPGT